MSGSATFCIGLRCVHCDARYALGRLYEGCAACATDAFRSGLTPAYDYDALRAAVGDGPLAEAGSGVWRYRRLLPAVRSDHEISLGEGGTPLISLPRIAAELGAEQVWLKDESRNPTLSFKDRHAAVAIAKALDLQARTVVASSSGNHGLAVAAYAARAGLRCVVLTYPGIAPAAAAMIQAYGAQLAVTSRGGRWAIVREAVEQLGWYPATNFTAIPTNSAYGHEGYKTIAYEIAEQLNGQVPDVVALPVGYGEGLFGVWKGYVELVALGRATRTPRMLAVEPSGGPLAIAAARAGNDGRSIARVPEFSTVARGIGSTVNSFLAVSAVRDSDGIVAQVTDDEILRAQRDLAREGIFAEPASAAVLAGARGAAVRGALPAGLRIVLVSTSTGLKNVDPILGSYAAPVEVGPTMSSLVEALSE